MKISLSTNWCNRRMTTGEEIADKAVELGFDELELGFHTTQEQVKGFKARLDAIPVGSVHAFAPVPISAPCGYPELYSLASFDEEARKMASFQVKRNVEFAAEMGADTVVLHAGRVPLTSWLRPHLDSLKLREQLLAAESKTDAPKYVKLLAKARKIRSARGAKLLDVFKSELEALVPVLERNRVVLALENLPYIEGFPDEAEMLALFETFKGAPVRGWFDTGHDRVRVSHGWIEPGFGMTDGLFAGMHLNDVRDLYDDHLPPGEGAVDFAALRDAARAVRHVVVEPSCSVAEENLRRGLAFVRRAFSD